MSNKKLKIYQLMIIFCMLNVFTTVDVKAYQVQEIGISTYVEKDSLPDPLAAGWKEGKVCELLKENERFRVLKCTFPPGGGHDKHYHKPHFGYALSGSTFQIEDKTGVREVQLKTGSHFTSDGVDWHRVVNVGDSTSVYIIFEPKGIEK